MGRGTGPCPAIGDTNAVPKVRLHNSFLQYGVLADRYADANPAANGPRQSGRILCARPNGAHHTGCLSVRVRHHWLLGVHCICVSHFRSVDIRDGPPGVGRLHGSYVPQGAQPKKIGHLRWPERTDDQYSVERPVSLRLYGVLYLFVLEGADGVAAVRVFHLPADWCGGFCGHCVHHAVCAAAE